VSAPRTHADAFAPVHAAIMTALAASSALTTQLGSPGLYDSEVTWKTTEAEAPEPYVVVQQPTGEEEAPFLRAGGNVRVELHIWARIPAKVSTIYAEIAATLKAPLALTGARWLKGRTQMIGTMRDPGLRRLHHGIARYEAQVTS
jgi:hypothetical protein